MLHSRQQRRFTPEEYLLLEERAETRSEYCRGEIFAMSGGTVAHNRIVRNILGLLDTALSPSKCEAFPSDLRLYVEKSQLFTYPDVLVVCGELPYLPGRSDTLTDATLLVEVLSPSTQECMTGGTSFASTAGCQRSPSTCSSRRMKSDWSSTSGRARAPG